MNCHLDILSLSSEDIGCTGQVKLQIRAGEDRPIRQPVQQLLWSKREKSHEQVEKMLEGGVIEFS